MNIAGKIREIYPNRIWERVEKECKFLISNSESKYFSFIRLGDGEFRELQKNGVLGYLIANAIKNSNLIGLPDHYENKFRTHQYNWDNYLLDVLADNYNISVQKETVLSSYIFLYAPHIIEELVRNKNIVWITGNVKNIKSNLLDDNFIDYFSLKNIVSNQFIDLPDSAGPICNTIPYSKIFQMYEYQLKQLDNFDVALVGSGLIGKAICNHITQNKLGSSIDIGCLMSAYKGIRNRKVFKRGNELDFLVWSQ